MTTSPHRLFLVRVALAALCLLPGAAASQSQVTTVTAPAGGMMPSAAPFAVQWASPGQGLIAIDLLTGGTGWVNLAGGIANTGQAQVSLPAGFVCDPQKSYRVQVTRYYSLDNGYSYYNISGSSAPFKFTCPITVTKQVVNTTGRRVSGSFRMRIQCEPGSQTFADIAASGPGSFTRKVHVPAGSSVCTVQETGMPLPPAGCTWLTTYPGGQQRAPGGAPVVVVNTLQCGPVTPPGPRR